MNADGAAAKKFDEAVKWIQINGGYVHPELRYDGIRRRVHLGRPAPVDGASDERRVVVDVDAGTTLLKIPDACLLTLHAAEADESFGESLFGAVAVVQSPSSRSSDDDDDDDDGGGVDRDRVREGSLREEKSRSGHDGDNGEGGESRLYHDAQDVILALFLAHLTHDGHRPECPSNSTSVAKAEATSSQAVTPWMFYRPYLDTLPSSVPSDESTPEPVFNNDHLRHLPRQWSATTLQRRLQGTSLYRRVMKEKRGLKREYELVKTAWLNKRDRRHKDKNDGGSDAKVADNNAFPPFEHYDTMMAALASRGFSGLGRDGVDALIPLLDLLNHVRGRGGGADDGGEAQAEGNKDEGSAGVKATEDRVSGADPSSNEPSVGAGKGRSDAGDECVDKIPARRSDVGGPDIRYERYEGKVHRDSADGPKSPASKRRRREGDGDGASGGVGGGVRVSASRSLRVGSALRMTYGAKGNAALLGRYGFCLPNNVEPDGSCNDVLELEISPKGPPVKLQRGPKSYCYGPFVKALELCRESIDESNNRMIHKNCNDMIDETGSQNAREDEGDESMDGGLEAFLDSCDQEMCDDEFEEDEEECDEDDNDCFYASANSNADRPAVSCKASMADDLRAIDALKGVLQNAKDSSANNTLVGLRDDDATEEDRYCAILVRSEIRTLDFYLAAADALRRQLEKLSERSPPHVSPTAGSERCPVTEMQETENRFDDDEVVREQVDALADAFLSIRYPQIKAKA